MNFRPRMLMPMAVATRTTRTASVACFAAMSLATSALAQPSDLTQHSERPAAVLATDDVTTFNASAGGSLNTGNTRAFLVNVGSAFALVRGQHGVGLTMDFAYGRANIPTDPADRFVDTVRSMRTRARYDLFLSAADLDAVFVAGLYRWDPFAGLDARAEGQLGYMRNLFNHEKHRLWAELGYDLTYDNYDPDPLPDPDVEARFLKGHAYVHSVRGFIGYDNRLNAAVTLWTGVEGLLDVEHPSDFRLNWDIAVRSLIVSRLQLELRFALQLDTVPVPGKEKVDAQTRINFIYTLI